MPLPPMLSRQRRATIPAATPAAPVSRLSNPFDNFHSLSHDNAGSPIESNPELKALAMDQLTAGNALQKDDIPLLSPAFNATLKMSSLSRPASVSYPLATEFSPQKVELQRQPSSGTVIFKPLSAISPLSDDFKFCLTKAKGLSSPISINPPNSKISVEEISGKDGDDEMPQKRNWNFGNIILFVLALISFCCLIPAIIFAITGSNLSTTNFFNSMQPLDREKMLSDLTKKYDFIPNIIRDSLGRGQGLGSNWRMTPWFDGISYSPLGTLEPECTFSQEEADTDIMLLSQITGKIRTYSTRCNQAEFILNAINRTQVPLKVALGIWISNDSSSNEIELSAVKHLVAQYPERYFESIFVGNEVRYRDDVLEEMHIQYIQLVKDFVHQAGKKIPVGTSELSVALSPKIAASCDFIGVNLNPFYENVPVEKACDWIFEFMTQYVKPLLPDTTKVVISEVGWPFNGGRFGESLADPASFNSFLASWLCEARDQLEGLYDWYYFEAFDEPWRALYQGNGQLWEGEWGLFSSTKQIKPGAILPVCR